MSIFLTISCTELDLEDQGIQLQELPNYVAFSVNGVGVTIDDIDIKEDGGTTGDDINVEIPGGTISDVTVNYAFSGTAVFGTDFTVAGATAQGGSVIIKTQSTPIVDGLPLNQDILVTLLTDGVTDGNKVLTITLTSASNAEGEIAVGRGGLNYLKQVNINIEDID